MADETKSPNPIVIDLGKQKRKKVKDLRRGEGSLMNDVRIAVAELESEGVVPKGAQPIIIVVERKSDSKGGMPMMNPMSMMRR